MRRALVVLDGDFTVQESGSHKRFADMISFLIRAGFDVSCYSARNNPTLPWTPSGEARFRAMFPTAILHLEKRSRTLMLLAKLKRFMIVLTPNKARKILSISLPWTSKEWIKLVRDMTGSALIVNFAHTLQELNGLPGSGVYVETHDVQFVNRARRKGMVVEALEALLAMRLELASLRSCEGLINISSSEHVSLKMLLPDVVQFLVPSYGSRRAFPKQQERVFDHDLLFVGSQYSFNVSGILSFFKDATWARRYRVALVGRICEIDEVRQAAKMMSNVALLGYVDCLSPVFRRSKLAISPVDGTGLKMKILDALQNGVPVLCSAASREGLASGYDGCVMPLDEENAVRLLENPKALKEATDEAIRYCEHLEASPGRQELERELRARPDRSGRRERL